MSQANRTSVKSLAEVTYGVTPANSADWQAMRYKAHDLGAMPKTVISEEIRADRMVSDLIVVGQEVKGNVGIELSATSYDEWMEAALCGTWSTNVLKAGIAERSFSIEVGHEDWSPVQYLQYTGMRIAGFNMDFAYGAVVSGQFQFAGKSAAQSTTSLIGSGSVDAATTTSVMNASAGITAATIDGSAPGAAIKKISLKLDNTLRPVEGIGQSGPTDQSYGRSMVTGTIEMYFETIAMYNKLIAGTSAALAWTVAQDSKSYAFSIPKLKFNSGNPPVTGPDTDVMISLEFTALYDSGSSSQISITRVP